MRDRITPEELDARLNSPEQLQVREWVRALPNESLSMAWRSELNEKLLKSLPRKTASWTWLGGAGLALGACAAALLVLRFQGAEPNGAGEGRANLEAAVVSAYQESERLAEIGGYGLRAEELDTTTSHSDAEDWTEADLGAL